MGTRAASVLPHCSELSDLWVDIDIAWNRTAELLLCTSGIKPDMKRGNRKSYVIHPHSPCLWLRQGLFYVTQAGLDLEILLLQPSER
jgi:hypothetical protein